MSRKRADPAAYPNRNNTGSYDILSCYLKEVDPRKIFRDRIM